MAETKTERKVTVIQATDVVGYSVKMEENEDQTLKNLKVYSNRRLRAGAERGFPAIVQ